MTVGSWKVGLFYQVHSILTCDLSIKLFKSCNTCVIYVFVELPSLDHPEQESESEPKLYRPYTRLKNATLSQCESPIFSSLSGNHHNN